MIKNEENKDILIYYLIDFISTQVADINERTPTYKLKQLRTTLSAIDKILNMEDYFEASVYTDDYIITKVFEDIGLRKAKIKELIQMRTKE